jgi:ABC-type nitrate/sulfonate/bicarbonate transport system permease component
LLLIWQGVCAFGWVPAFMLPSPLKVGRAFVTDFPLLMRHMLVSLEEAFIGLGLSIAAAVLLAVVLDRFSILRQMCMPLVVLTQTVPTIAIAPLLVLWLGYGVLPKIALIFITCFFPLCLALLGGLQAVDADYIRLYRTMGATNGQILRHVKLPASLDSFFSGLRISVSYAVVGAVIAEWLGGEAGLGVYMTRVRKGYAYDKMFSVILLISLLSVLLIKCTDLLQRKAMPYKAHSKQ